MRKSLVITIFLTALLVFPHTPASAAGRGSDMLGDWYVVALMCDVGAAQAGFSDCFTGTMSIGWADEPGIDLEFQTYELKSQDGTTYTKNSPAGYAVGNNLTVSANGMIAGGQLSFNPGLDPGYSGTTLDFNPTEQQPSPGFVSTCGQFFTFNAYNQNFPDTEIRFYGMKKHDTDLGGTVGGEWQVFVAGDTEVGGGEFSLDNTGLIDFASSDLKFRVATGGVTMGSLGTLSPDASGALGPANDHIDYDMTTATVQGGQYSQDGQMFLLCAETAPSKFSMFFGIREGAPDGESVNTDLSGHWSQGEAGISTADNETWVYTVDKYYPAGALHVDEATGNFVPFEGSPMVQNQTHYSGEIAAWLYDTDREATDFSGDVSLAISQRYIPPQGSEGDDTLGCLATDLSFWLLLAALAGMAALFRLRSG
jgi:hypothetical protein